MENQPKGNKMKTLLLLIVILTLSGCAMPPPAHMTAAEDFRCKQQCGYYDMRANIFSVVSCMQACQRSY